MKGKMSTILVIALVAIAFLWVAKVYNNLVTAEEAVNNEWSNVESQYQRRLDLLPNLVEVVKGYAAHEKETFEAVMEARAKASAITIDPSNITPDQMQAFQEAQAGIAGVFNRLMAVAENYPDLKANENFMNLQEQLEGTENRIQVARQKFNATAQVFNTTLRKFPTNVIGSMFGFTVRAYFESESGAEKAPKLEF